jgi:hypothetical protein
LRWSPGRSCTNIQVGSLNGGRPRYERRLTMFSDLGTDEPTFSVEARLDLGGLVSRGKGPLHMEHSISFTTYCQRRSNLGPVWRFYRGPQSVGELVHVVHGRVPRAGRQSPQPG